ncbi:MAG: carboxypeptidase regulatory-like domain-containing protein [Planctomycetes bacterium]|nr:carboxypeptidase regulatory-like domain-containing protein [Planctomycetota bacterium]
MRVLLGILLVAILGGAAYLFLCNLSPASPLTPGDTRPIAERNSSPPTQLQAGRTSGKGETPKQSPPEVVRTELDNTTGSGKEFAQGVGGVLVNPAGGAVAGARVYLMPGLGLKVMTMWRDHQKGVRFPPIARAETGADGSFRLGIEKWEDGAKYEVRIEHDEYCDHRIPNIDVQPRDWYDAGRVQLKPGVAVYGRVTTEGGQPIAQALITAKDGTGMLNLTPIPGRENGILATANQNGEYELRNLDPSTMYSMTASADGYARDERHELQFTADQRHQLDFRLPPGLDIGGTVVNPQGKPVVAAKITVAALSQKSRLVEETRTDNAGRFLLSGIRDGVYSVAAEAEGFQRVEEKPINAGEKELKITLEPLGAVLVTVLDDQKRPVANFHVNLKPAFKGQDSFGNPLVSKPVKGATDGTVKITGVNPMTYVAEVHAAGFAKNFSERFTITEAMQNPPHVTVELNRGGEIVAVITDSRGAPAVGVQVKTEPEGLIENPFFSMFPVPYTITKREVRTGKDGRVRFAMMFPGKYQLRLQHPEFCTDVVKDVIVEVGKTNDLGNVQISRGCLVSGFATVAGAVQGQVKVNVSAENDPKNPQPLSCEAISDNDGAFLLNKRLKPGRYTAMAASQVQANPLMMMVQFNKSKKSFTVAPGQEQFELKIEVPKLDD